MTNRLILSLLKIIILSLQFLINIYVDRSYMHCSRAHCGEAGSEGARAIYTQNYLISWPVYLTTKNYFLNLYCTNIISNYPLKSIINIYFFVFI